MRYHANHTLGNHTIFIYTFIHKGANYRPINTYWAKVDTNRFKYSVNLSY